MLADPENRLVVRSLESSWNQKLKELEKAKQDYAIYNSKKAWIPSEKEEQDILDLAQKISEIWNAPTSTPKEKKRIIRILIDDVTVLAEKRCSDFSIGIRFRSGKCEHLSLKRTFPMETAGNTRTIPFPKSENLQQPWMTMKSQTS